MPGYFPEAKDLLNNIERGLRISFLNSLIILGEILSGPGVYVEYSGGEAWLLVPSDW